jgi:hypothetical protein
MCCDGSFRFASRLGEKARDPGSQMTRCDRVEANLSHAKNRTTHYFPSIDVNFFVEFYAQQSTAEEETFCAVEKKLRHLRKTPKYPQSQVCPVIVPNV